MNVLILHGYGLTGSGSAIYTRDLAEALARNGHTVDVLCHDEDLRASHPNASIIHHNHGTNSTAYLRSTGGRLTIHAVSDREIPVMYPRAELSRGRVIADWSAQEMDDYVTRMTSISRDIVRLRDVDVVLVNHTALLCQVADRLARQVGTAWAVISHGTGLHYGVRRIPALAARVDAALYSAAAVVALNDAVRERIVELFPKHESRLCEVSPGVDLSLFSPQTKAAEPTVAYAGRLTLDKGIHALLAAWPMIRRSVPNAKLRLAGGGKDGEALQAAADALTRGSLSDFLDPLRTLGVDSGRHALIHPVEHFINGAPRDYAERARMAAGSISFVRVLDRVGCAEHLGPAHVAVLPALVPEAFPLSILEAVSCAAIPVGTDSSGLGWLLRQVQEHDATLGSLLVDPHPASVVTQLAQTVVSALETAQARPAGGSLRAFAQPYSWAAVGEMLLQATQRGALKLAHG